MRLGQDTRSGTGESGLPVLSEEVGETLSLRKVPVCNRTTEGLLSTQQVTKVTEILLSLRRSLESGTGKETLREDRNEQRGSREEEGLG